MAVWAMAHWFSAPAANVPVLTGVPADRALSAVSKEDGLARLSVSASEKVLQAGREMTKYV